ncbi:uncharacterized protein LOC9653271 [Selaginella moellendorffii]|uniref:uncharacterized protein LOC9653271 n=1 Tax=Selaginella moellendorffii TaxID=88036 RepID=UPI000D1CE707|nr:uncharacterized protein LOC9653271 [Selaginella moellendorffii]|eukprot:XP_024539012.1 uncharacterized protein LOC9653271 [Selaginella moellendorffii]
MAGKIEDDYASSFLEQARHCLRDGSYDRALSLLGRVERLRPTMGGISELAAIAQVCQAANWRCSCRMQVPRPRNPDWYRVLKVDEEADSIAIKKRYRQLALLLHPDKNKNVKSEEAFKLVSEAYACLSDRSLRRSFDIERSKSYCSRCYSQESLRRKTEDASKSQTNFLKTEQERLQMFREKARARVTSLTQDIRTRRSRWNADLESAREKYQNKRVDRKSMFSEDRQTRESDVFQPGLQTGRKFHVTPESDLMSILRGRRPFERERSQVSESLDGLLSRLRKDSREEFSFSSYRAKKPLAEEVDTPESSRPREGAAAPFTDGQFGYFRDNHGQCSDITNRFFSKRVSSLAETLPARKLFKEEDEIVEESLETAAAASDLRRHTKAAEATTETSSHTEIRSSMAASSEATPPPAATQAGMWSSRGHHNLRGNLVGDESSATRTEYTESLFCCGSRKSVLKEQRQKSEELLKTLERLRQEAKSVAATLDKLKRKVDSHPGPGEEALRSPIVV